MTDHGAGEPRYRLDLEMMERHEPGDEESSELYDEQQDFLRRLADGLEVRGRWTEPGDPGFDQSGISFFRQYRFTSDDPGQLLQLAHRYVADEDNPDAWEMVAIVEQATDQELELRVDAGSPNRGWRDRRVFTDKARMLIDRHPATAPVDGRFNLLNVQVRVTAPIGWDDERSREVGDEVRAGLRSDLELYRDVMRGVYPEVQLEFEL